MVLFLLSLGPCSVPAITQQTSYGHGPFKFPVPLGLLVAARHIHVYQVITLKRHLNLTQLTRFKATMSFTPTSLLWGCTAAAAMY